MRRSSLLIVAIAFSSLLAACDGDEPDIGVGRAADGTFILFPVSCSDADRLLGARIEDLGTEDWDDIPKSGEILWAASPSEPGAIQPISVAAPPDGWTVTVPMTTDIADLPGKRYLRFVIDIDNGRIKYDSTFDYQLRNLQRGTIEVQYYDDLDLDDFDTFLATEVCSKVPD